MPFKSLTTALFLFLVFVSFGQIPEYDMQNLTVSDCDGILYDSGGEGNYGNNEDYVFTIESGNPISITFVGQFCLDNGFDFLTIHDGPDILSPVLGGPFTGTDMPGSFTANSGSITIHFTSDNSAVFCGFQILWDTQVPPPAPPDLLINDLPSCGSNNIIVSFSSPVSCSSFASANFSLTGDMPFPVNNVVALNCSDGFATEAMIILGQSFNYNCNYDLNATVQVADECDSLWTYTVNNEFLYDQCGINAQLVSAADSICAGSCTEITLEHANCLTYEYSWNEGLAATDGPHEICPLSTTTYTVEVTEVETGIVDVFEFTQPVVQAQIDFDDQAICQSLPGFQLTGFPEDGQWAGPGMSEEIPGFFEPDSANIGSNVIYYGSSAFCYDSLIIDIIEADAGPIQAACPDTDPFGFNPSPASGIWSGPHIVEDSLFSPDSIGSFVIFYNAGNGCTDSTIVNVDNINGDFDLDTLCQSNFPDTLDFSPLGGTWYGPGIIDSLQGVYDPREMPAGAQQFTYIQNGCSQIADIYIKEIDVGGKYRTACPENMPFPLFEDFAPVGGVWDGPAITDTLLGIYDPSIPGNNAWTTNLYEAPNGCIDTVFVWNMQTIIEADTVYFCEDGDPLPLTPETVGRQPFGGQWTGEGLVNPENNYFEFHPSLSGPGLHMLQYEVNNCVDSILMIVSPNQLLTDSVQVCSADEPFLLDPVIPTGGVWIGPGIVDAGTGLYNPASGVPGESFIVWSTPAGCTDSVKVYLNIFQDGSITGLDSIYCYQDSAFVFEAVPETGIVTGPVENSTFNPAEAGPGTHVINLNFGENSCSSPDSVQILVFPELETSLTASDTLICAGSSVNLNVSANGGQPDSQLTYSWNNGLFGLAENTDSPLSETTYVVTTSDGCSEPVTDSITVDVLPEIDVSVSLSDTLCFGDNAGTAAIEDINLSDYTAAWGENPTIEANGIMADAGSNHLLTITDNNEGCTFDTLITIPAYPPISALFSVNPNEECIPFDDADPLQFIDLSQNAVVGIWDFGNGESEFYVPGVNPQVNYDVPNNYTVDLYVENYGGCPDSMQMEICVENPTPIFIPDIFSPNGDGANDVLYVRGPGIVQMNFQVFDRWGKMVFSSDDPDHGWDGNSNGKRMPQGVYVYYLNALVNDGLRTEMQGNVTLIR